MSPLDTFRPSPGVLPTRDAIPSSYTWDLTAICQDWDEWTRSLRDLEAAIESFKALQGTLAEGSHRLLAAFKALDTMGAISYRVWYYTSLQYDQDQRDNNANARRQQVQILFARQQQAGSWFNPEVLAIPIETVRIWLGESDELAVYRFAIESLFHEQEHVLDEPGERLMSFAGRFNSVPNESYAALTTADMQPPSITLSGGERVTLSYGQYRALLETNRRQEDRAAAFRALHRAYADQQNTYAALYNGVLQRDWFHARARGYATTLDAELHGNDIPTAVVENLITTTKHGVEPLRRYHRLRRRTLGVETYRLYDFWVPLVEHDARYPYDEVGSGSSNRSRRSEASINSRCAVRFASDGLMSTRTWASATARTRRRCTGRIRTCCSTTTRRSMRCSRWRTRWATRCTRCCRIRRSRSCTPATRFLLRRCRPR
jgi:oligoendopeptidase F